MGKIAFVFSGQGDQFPGMGKDLYDSSVTAKNRFDEFEKIRPGTLKQCFEGTEDELASTSNTQPCLYALELSQASVLSQKGVIPDAAAGFSSGEISAASFCGLFDENTGFRLVSERGILMEMEARKNEAFMAAVLKLSENDIRNICSRFNGVYPVNFNCPGQVTVSGLKESMDDFISEVRKNGGRCIPVKVRGAFHSPFMEKAAESFRLELEKTGFSIMRIPLYSNLTGEKYSGDPEDLLSRQISNPVLWEKIIRNMIKEGIDTFIEIGPGNTLSNMIRRIDPAVNPYTFSEYCELDSLQAQEDIKC